MSGLEPIDSTIGSNPHEKLYKKYEEEKFEDNGAQQFPPKFKGEMELNDKGEKVLMDMNTPFSEISKFQFDE